MMRWDGLASGMTQWQMMMAMVVLKCDVMDWWRGELLPYILIRSLHQALWSGREAMKTPPLTPASVTGQLHLMSRRIPSSAWSSCLLFPLSLRVAQWGLCNKEHRATLSLPYSSKIFERNQPEWHQLNTSNNNWAFLMLAGGCSQQHYNTYKK